MVVQARNHEEPCRKRGRLAALACLDVRAINPHRPKTFVAKGNGDYRRLRPQLILSGATKILRFIKVKP